MALKAEVCVATVGMYTKPGVHKLNPGWAERQNRIVLQAFRCISFFSPPCSPLLSFFLSQFFSHSINTLSHSSLPSLPLFLSLPPPSLVPHQNGEQMWRGTFASLMLNHSLIYQTGPSCSAMTGLNYRAWVCSKTASPTLPFPVQWCFLCVYV